MTPSGTGPAEAPMEFAHKLRTCLFLAGELEDAVRFYTSLLPDSRIEQEVRTDQGGPPLVIEFTLAGAPFMALAGNPDPKPHYTWSISVLTEDQDETDRLAAALIAGGGEEGRCGWLKDRFGIDWQIVPKALPRLMSSGPPQARQRTQAALMTMNRIDIAALEAAHAQAERTAS